MGKVKKVIVAILVFALVSSILIGCGNNAGDDMNNNVVEEQEQENPFEEGQDQQGTELQTPQDQESKEDKNNDENTNNNQFPENNQEFFMELTVNQTYIVSFLQKDCWYLQ